MKYLSILFIGLFIWTATTAVAGVLFEDDFEDGDLSGWSTGSDVSILSSGGVDNSKCVRISYSSHGTSVHEFTHNISSLNLGEVYVRFDYKVVNQPLGGAKFLKLMGSGCCEDPYANSTFMINYWSGKLERVAYGAGGDQRDTQNYINYTQDQSSSFDSQVNLVTTTDKIPVANTGWHSFEIHMKYNTDGNRDGMYRVWHDGNIVLHADNVDNRGSGVIPRKFGYLLLGNYSHDVGVRAHTWYLYYDNVIISNEYIGSSGGISSLPPPDVPGIVQGFEVETGF